MNPFLKLQHPRRPRVLRGHPWVFANEVVSPFPAGVDGEAIPCYDTRGRLLGTGLYNSRSKIIWRRLSRQAIEWGEAFLREAIERAVARRGDLRDGRLVWSESDDLPGLIVDRYDGFLVVQCLTLGMDRQALVIGSILEEFIGPKEIVFRNDAPVRRLEGMEAEVRTLSGRSVPSFWHTIGGIEYLIDLERGQKTGFYLDQRLEHGAVASLAGGRRVLDAFCNQGAFALGCARAGAASVFGIDASEEAIEQARRNAQRNGLDVRFEAENVFDFFSRNKEEFDIVVLDPPPFAKSKSELAGAHRGYNEINLRAMKCLSPGGILATYACSHHVQHEFFVELLVSAAADAGRKLTVIRHGHQPPDHPVLLAMPESEYLRGLVLRVD